MTFSNWHIPISETHLSLREARESLKQVGAKKKDIPLIVKLVENPAITIPGITLFHGAVDLIAHDYIHIILGRGLLPEDEAFTIGYTMGSTHQVNEYEVLLFELITKHLYPDNYQFKDRDIKIFRTALKIAEASQCLPLDKVKYDLLLDKPLGLIRVELGLNIDEITAYYRIEKSRYPENLASKRLLD